MRSTLEHSQRWVRGTRVLGVAASGVNLVLLGCLVHGAESPLAFPGGTRAAVEAAALLAIYGLAFAVLPGRLGEQRAMVLRTSGVAAALAGLLQVVHMALENFGARTGENAVVTVGFMLATFAVWAVAAYRASRMEGGVATGMAAACVAAMGTMMIAVTFGLALSLAHVPAADYVASWEEFKASGWHSARAFAIANSLHAAFGHLAVGPVLGGIFGFFGGVVGSVAARRAG